MGFTYVLIYTGLSAGSTSLRNDRRIKKNSAVWRPRWGVHDFASPPYDGFAFYDQQKVSCPDIIVRCPEKSRQSVTYWFRLVLGCPWMERSSASGKWNLYRRYPR